MKKYLIAALLLLGAVWTLFSCAPDPERVELTFLVDGETYAESAYYTIGGVTAPTADPEKEGYTFNGWYYDKDEWTQPFSTATFKHEFLPGKYTLHARFEPYTFTLNEDKVSYTLSGALPTATGDLIIPSRYLEKPVTAIAPDVFKNNDTITSVVIPDSVTAIGNSAFEECDALLSVALPSAVSELGNRVFAECRALTSATLGSVLQTVPASAFEGCEALKTVTVPRSVTKILNKAFFGCAALEELVLPAMLKEIGISALEGCSSLTSLQIPHTVTTIDARAFADASRLASVSFADNARLASVGSFAFSGTAVSSLVLPDTVKALYADAFDGTSLASLSFGSGVTVIGSSAFDGIASSSAVTYRGTVELFEAIAAKAADWSDGRTVTILCENGSIAP